MDLSWLTARPIAHRGLHDAASGIIENTLAAAEAAIQSHYAIECDVQLSRDGEVMVFHDLSLTRLTDTSGALDVLDAATLSTLSIKGSTETIPTLSHYLEVIAGRTPLIIEAKTRLNGDVRLAQRLATIARAYQGPLAIKSFDPDIIATLRRILSDIPLGMVVQTNLTTNDWPHMTPRLSQGLAQLLHYSHTRPDFLSWKVEDIPCASSVLYREALNKPVLAWTIRTEAQRQHASQHADQIVFEGIRF